MSNSFFCTARAVVAAFGLVSFLIPSEAFGQTPISCTANHGTGPFSGDYINSVYLEGVSDTLDNLSGVGAGDYTDFTGLGSTPDLHRGGTYTITIDGAGVAGAWIDYDGDGSLTASEFIGDCGMGACAITFTVPCSATLGAVVLRIMSQDDHAVGSGWEASTGACGSYSSGEDEDYAITILTAPGFSGLPSTMCDSEAPASLIGNSAPSGSFSSNAPGGFTNNADGTATFDPNAAGIGGPYDVTYTDACGTTSTAQVTVSAGTATPTFTGLAGPYCVEDAQVVLTGSPVGGVFSGPGITTQLEADTICIYDEPGGSTDPDNCTFTTSLVDEQSQPTTALQSSSNFTLSSATSIASIDYYLYFTACSGTSTFDMYVNGVLVDSWSDATNTCSNVGPGDFGYPYVHTVSGAILDANWNFGGNNTLAVQNSNNDNFIAGYSAIVHYTGASGAAFDPGLAGPGTHDIIYTYNTGGCDNADVQSVTVLSPPAIDAGADIDLCLGSVDTVQATGGVSYSWNQLLGAGQSHPVSPNDTTSYVVTGTDANGCANTDTVLVLTHQLPVPGFNGLAASYELCDPSDTLIGTPSGGVFSGSGVSGSSFDPGAAGVGGPYSITYTYTDGFGCAGDSVLTTSVTAFSGASLTGLSSTHCEQEGVVVLSGLPVGGTFSGPGIVSANVTDTVCIFDGTEFLNCTVGSNICNPNASIVMADSAAGYVIGNETAVSSIEFLLWYAYDLDGASACTGPLADFEFFLNGTSIGTFSDTNLDCSCTPNATAPLSLVYTSGTIPANWILEGGNTISVTQNSNMLRSAAWKAVVHYTQQVFDPATAGAGGPYDIIYSFSTTACSGADTVQTTVLAAPSADAGTDTTICNGQSVTLNGTGGAAQNWNQGLGSGGSQTVSPGSTTTYVLTTTAANTCTNTDTVTVSVNPLPSVAYTGLTSILQDCSDPDTLIGTPSGGSFSGTGISGNVFNPATAGVGGPYNITYAYTDGNNCTNTDVQTVTVEPFSTVSISGLNSSYCELAGQTFITTTPPNGTFTGPGISNAILADTVNIFDALPDTNWIWDISSCFDGELQDPGLKTASTNIPYVVAIDRIEYYLYFRPQSGTTVFSLYVNGNQVGSATSNFNSQNCQFPGGSTYPKVAVVDGAQINGVWNFSGSNTIGVDQNNPANSVAGYQAIVYYEAGNVQIFDPAVAGVGGPYTITYTVSDGACTGVDSATISSITPPPSIDAGADIIVCTGDTATLSATGGVSYTWSQGLGSGSTKTVNPIDTTMYIVTGTGSNGCTATDTVMVNPIPTLPVDAGANQTICFGESVTLTATGAATYSWNQGLGAGATQTVSPTSTTTYTVTGTEFGCSADDAITVTVNPLPAIDTTSMMVTLPPCGLSTGSISGITATGTGTPTYAWDLGGAPVSTQPDISSLSAGIYNLVVSDAVCSDSVQIAVANSGAPPSPTSSGGATYCDGDPVTNLTATALSGGSLTWYSDPFLNNVLGTGSTLVPSSVVTATYYVTETLAGCESLAATETVTINSIPVADAGTDTSYCDGGSVVLTATGGSSYSWDNGLGSGASQTVNPASPTTYHVTVTTNGCSATDSITVTVLANPTAVAGNDTTLCEGESLTLVGSGGTTQQWFTPFGTTAGNTFSGTISINGSLEFVLEATAANGCTDTDTVNVVAYSLPMPNLGLDQAICEGANVTLNATAGGGTYAWNQGLGSDSVYNVAPTTTTEYQVTVTNGNGCVASDSVTITVTPAPALDTTSAVVTDSDCLTPTGSVTGITGAAPGSITYTWQNAALTTVGTAIDLTGVGAGSYTLTAVYSGCTATTGAYSIQNTGAPAAPTATSPSPYCDGDTAADLTAAGAGGTITWYIDIALNTDVGIGASFSPGDTSATYYVTETSAGCESLPTAVTVTFNALPTADAGSATSVCPGQSATLTATGGTSYVWSNGLGSSASVTATPASTTTYTVTVTNANNCSATDTVTVTVSSNLAVNASPDTTVCAGQSVDLFADAGTSWTWSSGGTAQTETVSPTNTTTYFVTATDAGGCSGTDSVTVTIGAGLVVNAGPDTTVCAGQPVLLTADAGTSWLWSSGGTAQSETVNPTATTVYAVTATDANGCSGTASATVTIGGSIAVTAGPDTTVCAGQPVTLTAVGGSAWVWSSGGTAQTETVNPTSTTQYSVTATDGNGCTGTASATVSIIPGIPPVASFNIAANMLSVTVVDNSSNATSWSWDFGDGNTATTQNASNTYDTAGTYQITLTVSNVCASDDTTIAVMVNADGIGELPGSINLLVFPNPTRDAVTIRVPQDWINSSLLVSDAQGRVVATQQLKGATPQAVVDFGSLADGVYWLKLVSDKGVARQRVVLQR